MNSPNPTANSLPHSGMAALAVAAVATALTAAPATASPPAPLAKVNVTGEAANGATLSAQFIPAGVSRTPAGQLIAEGTLNGTLVDPTGAGHPITQPVTLPAAPIAGASSCQVTDLMLGPRDVDLLGLTMHLDQTQLYAPGACG